MTRPTSTPSPLDDMARATEMAQDQGTPPRAADDADCECDDCDCPICYPGCC